MHYIGKKINPAAGCLPILIQIPIFFALYKVLFVSIEMRHAPFFGWIKDLSAPDPTSLFNLFGLIPWDTPAFLTIGVWPLLMGLTMYLQQKINPPPPDPIQAKIFMMLPFIFTFLLATFPSGMVVYWTVNNILSIGQQYILLNKQTKEKTNIAGSLMNEPWKFIKEVYSFSDLPNDEIPEFIFWGRSNVGKSSLINLITKKK